MTHLWQPKQFSQRLSEAWVCFIWQRFLKVAIRECLLKMSRNVRHILRPTGNTIIQKRRVKIMWIDTQSDLRGLSFSLDNTTNKGQRSSSPISPVVFTGTTDDKVATTCSSASLVVDNNRMSSTYTTHKQNPISWPSFTICPPYTHGSNESDQRPTCSTVNVKSCNHASEASRNPFNAFSSK